MKITKSQLKQLIKEELEQTIDEAGGAAKFAKGARAVSGIAGGAAELASMASPEEEELAEEEQLDEAPIIPMIMSALKHPQVQQVLMDLVMPAIQSAMGGGDEGPPAE
jgi:precorrin-3B methylase